MKKLTTFLFVVGLVACGPAREAAWERSAPAAKPVEQIAAADLPSAAQAAWDKRQERAEIERAIAAWEQWTTAHPEDAEAQTRLSRALYFLADTHMRLANETEPMLATFERGVLAGERAMMATSPEFAAKVQAGTKVEEAIALVPPSGQGAMYWYASNLGKFATAKGFTTRLFYKDRIFAVMERVLSLDEKFFYAAPHRYFGAFYAVAPSFAGGDLTKAKSHFDTAIALDSRYLGTKVLYAEFYATKAGDKDLFVRLLNEVKAADVNVVPEIATEQSFEQQKADKLLAQIADFFG